MSWRERGAAHRLMRKEAHREANAVIGLCLALAGALWLLDLFWELAWPWVLGAGVVGLLSWLGMHAWAEGELARLSTERAVGMPVRETGWAAWRKANPGVDPSEPPMQLDAISPPPPADQDDGT